MLKLAGPAATTLAVAHAAHPGLGLLALLGVAFGGAQGKDNDKDKSGKPEKETKDQEKEYLWLKAAERETPPKEYELEAVLELSRAKPDIHYLLQLDLESNRCGPAEAHTGSSTAPRPAACRPCVRSAETRPC